MSDSEVEYLFGSDLPMADRAARRQGWHPHGRTGWIKPDGNTVHFICFVEQLSIIGKEVTVYVIGDLTPELKRFDRKWMKLRV
jgi:hypothetical protein